MWPIVFSATSLSVKQHEETIMISKRTNNFAGLAALLVGIAGIPSSACADYAFQTLDNNADPTFNQLLGVNNSGTIAGYFGIGSATNPNKGYTLTPPYGQANYTNENVPGSFQTQVTGLNNSAQTVGFSVDGGGNNFGFVKSGINFIQVVDPNTPTGAPGVVTVNQLLGVNDNNQAAGFYTDANGAAHGYVYNVLTGNFSAINVAGATSVTATGINNSGLVSGFFTDANGNTQGFLENVDGTGLRTLGVPGSTNTMFLGLNNMGQEVGTYVDANGTMHGLLFTTATQTVTNVDDPNGLGTTTVNGLNDQGQLVGFYVGGDGFTHGMLATNAVPEPASVALLGIGLTALLGYGHRSRLEKTDVIANRA